MADQARAIRRLGALGARQWFTPPVATVAPPGLAPALFVQHHVKRSYSNSCLSRVRTSL
jgi:hypothetical protein